MSTMEQSFTKPGDEPAAPPLASAAHSRFVQRIRRRYEAELPLLPPAFPAARPCRR